VLLIGESGVGKSTWINAFANYWFFNSLEEAEKSGGCYPIPSRFTTADPQTNKPITISSEGKLLPSAQITKAGESITKAPNEYAFWHANTAINFIDTPGLLDTDNAGKSTHDTDKKNVDSIIKLLSTYQKIHAIFILIKANVSRLSDALQYTLTEIFKRLDKSACNNVIFIFTNAGSVNFKPDETRQILQRFLGEKNLPVALPPEKPTIYCFENGIMKYLAECKTNIPHKDDDEDAHKSWQRSVDTTKKLIDYLCSFEPHSLAMMMSINDATNMVSMISKLLLDTMMRIFEDVNEMTEKKTEAQRLKEKIKKRPTEFASEELKEALHITEHKAVYERLGHVNVVCESSRCSKVESGHVVYPKICCEACTCSSFAMYFCSSVSWLGNCTVCGCNKSQHRWRTTKTKIVTKTRTDDEVINKIVNSNEALKCLKEGISHIEKKVEECKHEIQQMIAICAKLNAFAHQNASLGASSTDEFLECLENQKQTYAKSTNASRQADHLGHLAEIELQYKQHFSEAMGSRYSVEDGTVPKLIKQLYELPMKGEEIRQAVDANEESRRKVIEEGKKSKRNLIGENVSAIASYFLKCKYCVSKT